MVLRLSAANELLIYRLNSIHNIHYYTHLMDDIRDAIRGDALEEYREDFYKIVSKKT